MTKNPTIRGSIQFIDILEAILSTDVYASGPNMFSINEQFLLQIIQLCLTPILLEHDNLTKLLHFDLSQEMVYESPYNQPLFEDEWMVRLNVQLCLATVNFFRYHLKQHAGGEGHLTREYMGLEAGQLPKTWLGRLKKGTQPLGAHWKSAYSKLTIRIPIIAFTNLEQHTWIRISSADFETKTDAVVHFRMYSLIMLAHFK